MRLFTIEYETHFIVRVNDQSNRINLVARRRGMGTSPFPGRPCYEVFSFYTDFPINSFKTRGVLYQIDIKAAIGHVSLPILIKA